MGSHASAERPATGQKQNVTVSKASASAEVTPIPPGSERIMSTPAVRLVAINTTWAGRKEPISPRRSSGPKR